MNFTQLKIVKDHPQINCPDCFVPMISYSCANIIVDKCSNCEGIWFDKKELGIFRDSLKNLAIEKIESIDVPVDKDDYIISSCPRCLNMLGEASYGYNSKVTLRRCQGCEGIWLPQNELLKFINCARIGKIIEPDVKDAINSWTEFNKKTQKLKERNRIFASLSSSAPYWRYIPYVIIPLYDVNPRHNKPWVTTTFIFFNVLLFLFSFNQNINSQLGLIPGDLRASSFLTYMFTHGGPGHLLGNIFYLWTFGDNIEDVLGPLKYFFFYIICGLLAGVAHIAGDPTAMIPVIGASGAIAGLMGAYIYFFPSISMKIWIGAKIIDIPIWIYLGCWIMNQLIQLSFLKSHTSIAFGAHLGGFIAGLIIAFILMKLELVSNTRKNNPYTTL